MFAASLVAISIHNKESLSYMSGLRRIIGNTLISLFGQLVTWSSTLALTIAYGRFLGDFKFGELYFAVTFVSLVGFPVESGFNQQLTRDVAEHPEQARAYLWNTLVIKALLWVVSYGIIIASTRALGYSQEQFSIVVICGISLFSGSIVNTFAALHYAFERTLFPSVGMMLEKGLSALVGFILLKNGATVQTMALVLLGGSVIDALWVGFWFFKLVGIRIDFNRATMGQLIRNSIPFIVYGVLGVIYYRIDTVLLSLMTNTEVVGWYGAGYRLFDTLLFIPNLILNAVMYPVFSKLAVKSPDVLKTAVTKCANLLLMCVIPIATLLIIAAPNIIGFLYHRSDFLNSIPVVQALAPGLVFLYINTLFTSIIGSTKKEKKIPIMAAIALVFNLSLNLFLIPHYAQVGAALVTSATELLLLCISFAFIPRSMLSWESVKVGAKTLVAALFMASIIFLFFRSASILLILPVAFFVYCGIATLLRTIPREDVQALYKAVARRGSGGAVETLAAVADENIYRQITDPRLPAVSLQRALSEMETMRIPATPKIEYLATIPLPSALAKYNENRSMTEQILPPEKVATQLLPAAIDLSSEKLHLFPEEIETVMVPVTPPETPRMSVPYTPLEEIETVMVPVTPPETPRMSVPYTPPEEIETVMVPVTPAETSRMSVPYTPLEEIETVMVPVTPPETSRMSVPYTPPEEIETIHIPVSLLSTNNEEEPTLQLAAMHLSHTKEETQDEEKLLEKVKD